MWGRKGKVIKEKKKKKKKRQTGPFNCGRGFLQGEPTEFERTSAEHRDERAGSIILKEALATTVSFKMNLEAEPDIQLVKKMVGKSFSVRLRAETVGMAHPKKCF